MLRFIKISMLLIMMKKECSISNCSSFLDKACILKINWNQVNREVPTNIMF